MIDVPYDEFVATLPKRFPSRAKAKAVRVASQPVKALVRRRRRGPTPNERLKRQPIPDAEYMKADPCSYCGGRGHQFDHVEPVSKGGAHDSENVTRTCWRCNRLKGTKPLLLWLALRAAGDTPEHDTSAPPMETTAP